MRPRIKWKWKRPASNDADLRNDRMNQAGKFRGGGSGGLEKTNSAGKFSVATRLKLTGANSRKFRAIGGYSSLVLFRLRSDFFSDFFPAAIVLHKQQGCCPSKVLEIAVEKFSQLKLAASIVVHATDCSNAQCRPNERTSTSTETNLTAERTPVRLVKQHGMAKEIRR